MSDTFIAIAAYDYSHEANAALSDLKAAGIPAFLSGELTTAFQGTSGMGPNIQLLVHKADFKRAADIMLCLGDADNAIDWDAGFSAEEGYWICSSCDEAVEEDADICSSCKSPRHEREFDSP